MKKYLAICDQVYESLKGKIVFGIYPEGAQLSSLGELCESYGGISMNTVKRVLGRLSREGWIETSQGRRARVATWRKSAEKMVMEEVEKATVEDIVCSAGIISDSFIWYGAACCDEEDVEHFEELAGRVGAAADRMELWRLANQFWRLLIVKTGNELAVRLMDNIGYTMLIPSLSVFEVKDDYIRLLYECISLMKEKNFDPAHFDLNMFGMLFLKQNNYGLHWLEVYEEAARNWPESIGKGIRSNERIISTIYMDIIGQTAEGYYQKGDRLPAHSQLCVIYNASHDSTVKAVRRLRELGVVSSVRGKGIFVHISAAEAEKVWATLDRAVISSHFRQCMDTLEVISMTIGKTAARAAENMSPEEARTLLKELKRQWKEKEIWFSLPVTLLDFIGKHIRLRALNEIYKVLRRNFLMIRCIPGLIIRAKPQEIAQVYRLCVEAAEATECSDQQAFAAIVTKLFEGINRRVSERCRQMGYWEYARDIYDESLSWK